MIDSSIVHEAAVGKMITTVSQSTHVFAVCGVAALPTMLESLLLALGFEEGIY